MKISQVCLVFLAFLSGCGSGGDSETPKISINGNHVVRDINAPARTDVEIIGNDHVIRILSGSTIGTLGITGNDSLITVKMGATVERVTVNGNDSVIHLPAGLAPSVTLNGTGNQIVYDSTSG